MEALFNRGICRALESAAIAELEQRLERAQRLRLDCEIRGLMSLFVYKGDLLLAVSTLLHTEPLSYDLHTLTPAVGTEHRLLCGQPPHSVALVCEPYGDCMTPPLRGLVEIEFCDAPAFMLDHADLAMFLRELLQLIETRYGDAVRQGNLDAVRQLAAALDVEL